MPVFDVADFIGMGFVWCGIVGVVVGILVGGVVVVGGVVNGIVDIVAWRGC